jgi:hypothetical protein
LNPAFGKVNINSSLKKRIMEYAMTVNASMMLQIIQVVEELVEVSVLSLS